MSVLIGFMILFCVCSVIFMYHAWTNCTDRMKKLEKKVEKLNNFIERNM